MIRPNQIPPEVVDALIAYLTTCERHDCTAEAIAAALNAWPEVFQNPHGDYFITHRDAIILPLAEAPQRRISPKESGDD